MVSKWRRLSHLRRCSNLNFHRLKASVMIDNESVKATTAFSSSHRKPLTRTERGRFSLLDKGSEWLNLKIQKNRKIPSLSHDTVQHKIIHKRWNEDTHVAFRDWFDAVWLTSLTWILKKLEPLWILKETIVPALLWWYQLCQTVKSDRTKLYRQSRNNLWSLLCTRSLISQNQWWRPHKSSELIYYLSL